MSDMKASKSNRTSKYDKPIKINASPKAVVKSLFHGKPKPKSQWRYLKENQQPRSR